MFGSSRRFAAFALAPSLAIALIAGTGPGIAHHAPTGWQYPYACCSDQDCREVASTAISEGPDGYLIKKTGEVVGYHDKRLHHSPDGMYHWCSVAGSDTTRTICLFVPPQLF